MCASRQGEKLIFARHFPKTSHVFEPEQYGQRCLTELISKFLPILVVGWVARMNVLQHVRPTGK
ncbi:hypothetical protein WI71_15510 [Burkholderia diffusa]|nr:hypothetical protein WI71_15510 [Burkholderia diffusa]